MERLKPGRPSKGKRRLLKALGPEDWVEIVNAYAKQHGLTTNDLVLDAVATKIGVNWTDQPALPLDQAA